MRDLSESVKLFRSSARFYLSNKKMSEEYMSGNQGGKDDRLLNFILEDLRFAEDSFEVIRTKCGPSARLITYLLYVENRKQVDVAEMLGISRRQLQYSLDRWMKTAFDPDQADIPKAEQFKESCRTYEKEKALLADTSEKNELLEQCLREDIAFIENCLACFHEKCGEDADRAVNELFVDKKTQTEAAAAMGVSRRKLQYLIDDWFCTVFGQTA